MEKQELQDLQKKVNRLSGLGITTLVLIVVFAVGVFYTISKFGGVAKNETKFTAVPDTANQEADIDFLFEDDDPEKSLAPDTLRRNGMQVRTDFVAGCLKAYEELMKKHGIIDKVESTNLNIKTTSMITYDESFRGRELKNFLRRAAYRKRMVGGGYKLTVRVAIGVYTQTYMDSVNKGHTKPIVEKDKLGRIAIFLMTRTRGKNEKPELKEDGPDDDISFDLGEINPPKQG